jgi:hypothetical protein
MYENIIKNISGSNSKMNIVISWDVMLSNLLNKYLCFGGISFLHIQGKTIK